MVGGAAGGQRVHRGLQVGHRGDELGVLGGRLGKADYADAAAGANLPCPAAGGLVDDVDEGIRAGLEIGKGAARHAAGAVQDEDDVGGVAGDIGLGCERQRYLESAAAFDAVDADFFVRAGDAHRDQSFLSALVGAQYRICAGCRKRAL